MSQVLINRGDPQPIECTKCEDFHGYRVSDNLLVDYYTSYNADGSFELGGYGDYQRTKNKGVTCYCANCCERLKFKVIKEDS